MSLSIRLDAANLRRTFRYTKLSLTAPRAVRDGSICFSKWRKRPAAAFNALRSKPEQSLGIFFRCSSCFFCGDSSNLRDFFFGARCGGYFYPFKRTVCRGFYRSLRAADSLRQDSYTFYLARRFLFIFIHRFCFQNQADLFRGLFIIRIGGVISRGKGVGKRYYSVSAIASRI